MASRLPAFPRTIFTIIEPISLVILHSSVGGFLGPLLDANWFIAQQLDKPSGITTSYDDNARLVALQLGNTYGLLFLIGVAVLYTTTELKVVRNYIIALWIADITHVGLTCWALGYDQVVDVSSWSAVTWGNVGFTTFLCLTRTAWLLGLFGPDRQIATAPKKKT